MQGTIDTFDVLGIPVSVTTLDSASAIIREWARDEQARFVFIRDVHGVMQAHDNPELLALHQQAAMVTPDGMPLVWLGKLSGKPVSRTCGPDLMERVLRDSPTSGLRHYFYGGRPGIAGSLKERFEQRFPGLRIVGADTPPFRAMTAVEIQSAARAMRESAADVIWIGISSPKQEFLMRDLAPHVSATLIGVGAAFDFHVGAVRRAPGWMQRSGLEWLWRLMSEPRRLWRRYLIHAPRFIGLIVGSKVIGRGTG